MSASIGTRDSTEIIYIRHQLDSYPQAFPTFSKEKRAKEELVFRERVSCTPAKGCGRNRVGAVGKPRAEDARLFCRAMLSNSKHT